MWVFVFIIELSGKEIFFFYSFRFLILKVLVLKEKVGVGKGWVLD